LRKSFDRVLLQVLDILDRFFKYGVSYRQLTFITETFELLVKCCAKYGLLFRNIQCVTYSLENLNFKVSDGVSIETYQLFQ